jgi:hypothetical protein
MTIRQAPSSSAVTSTIHSSDSGAPVKAIAAVVFGDVVGSVVVGVVVALAAVGVVAAFVTTVATVTGVCTVLVEHVVAGAGGGVGVPQLGPLHVPVLVMVPVESDPSAVTENVSV